MDRRQFFLLAASGSAFLLLGERGMAALAGEPKPRFYGAFEALPVGAVKPQGWLRTYMEKQAVGLGSKLEGISWPFTAPYWKGETEGPSWWPWEQKAYWIDGATRLAIVLDDQKLLSQVRETIDYTLNHVDSDGYIGPAYFKEPKEDFHRWPHTLFFRGLGAAEESGAEPKGAVDAMRRHFLSDQATYGKPTRNVTNIEPMLWCYAQTGDPALLALAEKAWADYLEVAHDPEHGDLSTDRVFANTAINAHGVTYIETAKQPAILYAHTGKEEYLKFALAAQQRVFDHHMLIDGIPSTSEWYRTTKSLDSHETCCITDHAWSWSHVFAATGDGAWGDRIERAVFNAGAGAIKNDWKAVQYFSCPNQFLATLNSDHNAMAHGGRMMAYQPNPGHDTACCGGNIHRLLPNYVIRMWMRGQDGGLAATLYGPSKVTTTVGTKNLPIEIEQTTDYPFDEHIHLKLKMAESITFPLSLRIPSWCANPRVTVNGRAESLAAPKNGFVTITREFHHGDTVTLTLPMQTAVTHWPESGLGVEHGPLVYSLAIGEAWSGVVEPRYSTIDFPSWNCQPTKPWNYGIVDAPDLAHRIKFHRTKMTEDPWSNPPTSLTINAAKVDGWALTTDSKNPTQHYTPPLPPADSRKSSKPERITLVPYGSTHLRLTIFPIVSAKT